MPLVRHLFRRFKNLGMGVGPVGPSPLSIPRGWGRGSRESAGRWGVSVGCLWAAVGRRLLLARQRRFNIFAVGAGVLVVALGLVVAGRRFAKVAGIVGASVGVGLVVL